MPPVTQSNVEKYLSVIAGHGGEVPSEPFSRVEYYLDEIVKSGGIGGKLKPEIVTTLPATGVTGILYLIRKQGASGQNVYDEYIWIEDDSKYELLGQTNFDIDLSEYVKNTRKVGGVPLSSDVYIQVTAQEPVISTNTSFGSTRSFEITHKDSGVTAGSKGDTTNQTPAFGGTFKVLSATVDAKGHVTALGDHTVKIPDTEATISAKGLMSATDKTKLDKHIPKGSAVRGIYIDESDNTQAMTHELNADVPSGFAPASAAPLMDETASVGTSAKYAREDHKHPTDTSRASADDLTALINYIKSMDVYRNTSGNPATFNDGSASPVRNLSVTIAPTQEGSGDPSPTNVRPISGATSVSVTRTGHNLWGGGKMLDDIRNANCGATFSGTKVTLYANNAMYNYPFAKGFFRENTQYTFILAYDATAVTISGLINLKVFYTDGTVDRLDRQNGAAIGTRIFVSAANKTVSSLQGDFHYASTTFDSALCGIFEDVVTAEDFEAYQGQSVTVQLTDGTNPLTVYGGTLNVTTGELTVAWANIASYNGETLPGRWISDRDVYAPGTTPTTGAQVVYELATPFTYNLTPQQLATLYGSNTISSDAGSVSVTYRADPSLIFGGG